MNKNRYIILAALLVVTVFAFEYYFLAPKSEMLRESIEEKYNAVRREELSLTGANVTEKDIKALITEMGNIEKRLIQDKSEFLASARLQGEVSDIFAKAGLRVMTTRPLPAVKAGNYNIIPVYVEGNGNIKQLSDFLKDLESSRLLVKIDKLNVNITNLQNPRELKFKIQVSGLAKL
jgi:Tfp pilus assembly protein PilO